MDSTLTAKKAKLLELFQCAICHDGVKDTQVCSACSRFYCYGCIQGWFRKSNSCPSCRAHLDWGKLVKMRPITELQESVSQLLTSLDAELCGQHKQQLTLFCFSCEDNICVNCLFETNNHLDHKEQVVLIGEAYDYYKETLTSALVWTTGRQSIIHERLKTFAENQQQLNIENEKIGQIDDSSKKLLAGQGSCSAMTNIRNVLRKIKELRSKDQQDTEAIRIDRREDYVLEPVVVEFCMPEFSKQIPVEDKYQLNSIDSNGFEWKCTLSKWTLNDDDDDGDSDDDEDDGDGSDDEEEDYDYFCCYLSLIKGTPSDYSITFGNKPERVRSFKLNEIVPIGYLDNKFENDTCRVVVEIRQSFADKIQLLQDKNQQLQDQNQHLQARIAKLEKQCAKQKSSKS